ncbi:hypothetical protein [Photobacterium carnosum]|uniref:hypothetical protein n=1 Tax=Photobacterium carnosum TaxID=2023717 RepID=UPI001C928B68|nr:hypothetical protein [Photobacterium carnosum]
MTEKKLTKLEKIKTQIEALQAKANAEKMRTKSKERKEDTRKKILIGAMVLDGMNKSETYHEKIIKNLDGYLTSKHDRILFGLNIEKKQVGDELEEQA